MPLPLPKGIDTYVGPYQRTEWMTSMHPQETPPVSKQPKGMCLRGRNSRTHHSGSVSWNTPAWRSGKSLCWWYNSQDSAFLCQWLSGPFLPTPPWYWEGSSMWLHLPAFWLQPVGLIIHCDKHSLRQHSRFSMLYYSGFFQSPHPLLCHVLQCTLTIFPLPVD